MTAEIYNDVLVLIEDLYKFVALGHDRSIHDGFNQFNNFGNVRSTVWVSN